ncbi:MAG: TolC family protein, partial [Myxococcota bacterium]
GASLTVPVFNGGALRASQRQAEMDLVALERTREAIRQAVAAQSVEAVNRAYAASVQADLRRAQVEAVNRTLASVLDAYSRGAATQTTVTEARTSALQAELSALDATYEALQRSYDVLYAAGAMPTPSAPSAPSQLRDAVRAIFEATAPDAMEAEP